MPNIMTGFRVSQKLLACTDRLTKKLQCVERLAVLSKVTPSNVRRMALLEGVKAAEEHHGLKVCELEAAPWERKDIKRGKEKMPQDSPLISLTLPMWLLDRVDRVANTTTTNRSVALRDCMSEGLEILNERYKTQQQTE